MMVCFVGVIDLILV